MVDNRKALGIEDILPVVDIGDAVAVSADIGILVDPADQLETCIGTGDGTEGGVVIGGKILRDKGIDLALAVGLAEMDQL